MTTMPSDHDDSSSPPPPSTSEPRWRRMGGLPMPSRRRRPPAHRRRIITAWPSGRPFFVATMMVVAHSSLLLPPPLLDFFVRRSLDRPAGAAPRPPPVLLASAASTLTEGDRGGDEDNFVDEDRGGGGLGTLTTTTPVVEEGELSPAEVLIGDDGLVEELHGGGHDDDRAASTEHPPSSSSSSSSSRSAFAISNVHRTSPHDPPRPRRTYPQSDPQVCLAFLSCCNRTDLLDSTMGAALRHMEEDEPRNLRYEVAWVDNGSDREGTDVIESKYQIERALVVGENMGLAWGMNALIFDLCRAPYILLLEEDWLYMDGLVALQTPQRRRAVSTALALTSSNLTGFDGREVMGVFLRPETYDSFLKFPHAGRWETLRDVRLPGTARATASSYSSSWDGDGEDDEEEEVVDVEYRIYCSDPTMRSSGGWVWGSYTNGAALYSRGALLRIGRMYGEPRVDVFHDAYTEGNYAYRAGLKYCHAAVRLEPKKPPALGPRTCRGDDDGGGGDRSCRAGGRGDGDGEDVDAMGRSNAAFYHIGGGRGTRRRTAQGTRCADESWFFYGTPTYEVYRERRRVAFPEEDQDDECTVFDRAAMSDARSRNAEGELFRAEVARENREAREMENERRDVMRSQARIIRDLLGDADDVVGHGDDRHRLRLLRETVPWMETMTVEQIRDVADRLERLADSPHPVGGYWDSHGRLKVDPRAGGGSTVKGTAA